MNIARGILCYNTRTQDYGVSLNIPILFDHTGQWNVPVRIPGSTVSTWWHVSDVICAPVPYRALSVGDMVLVKGRGETQVKAIVTYINRDFSCIALAQGNKVAAYKGPVYAAMPASVRA